MASDLRTIVTRLQTVPPATGAVELDDEPKLVIEPGESRYQRKSANLRSRAAAAAAIEVTEDDVTIDLTGD